MGSRSPQGALAVAVVGALIGAAAFFGVSEAQKAIALKHQSDGINAKIISATPARQLVVMNVDGTVIGEANKKELLGTQSQLYYLSRAKFEYFIDMKSLVAGDFKYDQRRTY